MSEVEQRDDDEISLFALGAVLLRGRWRIAGWMLFATTTVAASVWSRPLLYEASASFLPQGTVADRSALAGLAGQFGVAMPSRNLSNSVDFYSDLIKSRVVLLPIVHDTFIVKEMNDRRVAFMDLFEIAAGPLQVREEEAVKGLADMVTPEVIRATGVVRLAAATSWPSVSLAVVKSVLNGVNEFNQHMRQGQAVAEREFVEGRLDLASADLRAVEDRMQSFLTTNRQWTGSPQLTFEHERIQRDLVLKQQVFSTLTQSYEDARIREVRDTPVITVFEAPSVGTVPLPRGRLSSVFIGFALGGLVGALWVLSAAVMEWRQKEGNVEVDEFVSGLREIREEFLAPVRWLRKRMVRGK